MRIIKLKEITEDIIKEIITGLNQDKLIIYPTETSYGVGVNALSKVAVSKLLKYKNRPAGKAISVAVASKDQAEELIETNVQATNILTNFLPGPITVIAKSRGIVDSRLESELGTLGIRIPAFDFLLELLAKYALPITATSANYSGGATPYNIDKLLESLPAKSKDLIDIIIDAGELEHNPPSLVIDTTQTNKVYRSGVVEPEDLTAQTIISNSATETKLIAQKLITKYLPTVANMLITLEGELGAGKTQFVSGIGAALGIKEIINSPTFTIVKEYDFMTPQNQGKLYHLDLWRLTTPTSLESLGIEAQADNLAIICVEWPDQLLIDSNYKIIKIKLFKINQKSRRIIIRPLF